METFGKQMVEQKHYATPEVNDRLNDIRLLRDQLNQTWKDKQIELVQGLDYQNFMRECEQAENWMANRESFLATPNEDDDNVESMIKKHEDLGKAINSQEEKIATLFNFADQLVKNGNPDSTNINKKMSEVLNRWKKLKDALIDKKSKLGESKTLQQFSQDADEIENWIAEKLQAALDESYRDPSNQVDSKHQKHQGNVFIVV